jgi:hypothetical protein
MDERLDSGGHFSVNHRLSAFLAKDYSVSSLPAESQLSQYRRRTEGLGLFRMKDGRKPE